ncbi:MAG: Smr/MutS family protein [Treponema sp.]|nr:Smr/MutS family protein [Treponema sp.]
MDMNEILEKWDKINSKKSSDEKKSNHIMNDWLDKYGTIDKDQIAEHSQHIQKFNEKNYIQNLKCEETLDLHGYHQKEAEQLLENFINECVRRKLKKVLIIHGKGIHTKGTDPVLKETVRKFIECNKHCGASGHPKSNAEGGSGATWIVLK